MAPTEKLYLFTSFIVLGAATPAGERSEVTETSATFSCCSSSPTIHFNQHCDNTWTIHGMTIAYSRASDASNSACVSPCSKVEGAEMTLEMCVDVNVTTVCREMHVVVEKRTIYQSRACPESWSNAAGRHDAAASMLLALLSAGRFVVEMIR